MYALIAAAVIAQQFLPAGPVMVGGLADAREPRVALGFVVTDLLADELAARPGQGLPTNQDVRHDTQGTVRLGTNFPILQVGRVVASIQGGVISRFRLETSDNDEFSSDYTIALPLSYRSQAWSGRIRIVHRSSHIGDELVLNSTIRRLEFDHEEVDALIARQLRQVRLYAGGTLTIASSFAHDKSGIQLGADGAWPLSTHWSARLGVDWQRHTISQGNSQLGVAGGLVLVGSSGRIGLDFLGFRGGTPVGEFFLDRESYWGLQLTLGR